MGVCQFQSSALDSDRSFVTLNVICVIAFDNSKYSAPTTCGFAACGHPLAFLLGFSSNKTLVKPTGRDSLLLWAPCSEVLDGFHHCIPNIT